MRYFVSWQFTLKPVRLIQSMSLKFGEQEAGEELMSAALYVEEGQGEDEGAPQDGMAYLRLPPVFVLSKLCNSFE